ncbi:MAG: ATP-binding protein [Caldilineaceae bacterium]
MNAPVLVLLKGHPATGKSTLARALARHLGWPLIDKDDVKDFTRGLPGGNGMAYDVAWRIADTQLGLGLSCIVDTPLSYPQGYDAGCRLAEKHGAHVLVVETHLDDDEWRRRLDARPPAESTHKINNWADMQALLAQYDGCFNFPIDPAHHLIVDTTQPVPALLAQVCDCLPKPSP